LNSFADGEMEKFNQREKKLRDMSNERRAIDVDRY
jgi:hypothetical protein